MIKDAGKILQFQTEKIPIFALENIKTQTIALILIILNDPGLHFEIICTEAQFSEIQI